MHKKKPPTHNKPLQLKITKTFGSFIFSIYMRTIGDINLRYRCQCQDTNLEDCKAWMWEIFQGLQMLKMECAGRVSYSYKLYFVSSEEYFIK